MSSGSTTTAGGATPSPARSRTSSPLMRSLKACPCTPAPGGGPAPARRARRGRPRARPGAAERDLRAPRASPRRDDISVALDRPQRVPLAERAGVQARVFPPGEDQLVQHGARRATPEPQTTTSPAASSSSGGSGVSSRKKRFLAPGIRPATGSSGSTSPRQRSGARRRRASASRRRAGRAVRRRRRCRRSAGRGDEPLRRDLVRAAASGPCHAANRITAAASCP